MSDALIDRLRERIADPERRLDARPSEFGAAVAGMGARELFGEVRSFVGDLRRLRRDGPTDEIVAKAQAVEERMKRPVARDLPSVASPDALASAEQRMGVALPPMLRRLYLEVANGGFGPGYGILGVRGGWSTARGQTCEDVHASMLQPDRRYPKWIWPRELVPIVDHSGAFSCIDTSTAAGRIVQWDPEALDGAGRDGGWASSFQEEASSLSAWLGDWLDRPTMAEQTAELVAKLQADIPEVTRQHWVDMGPEERAKFGLPRTGWGRELFGDAWGDDPRDQE